MVASNDKERMRKIIYRSRLLKKRREELEANGQLALSHELHKIGVIVLTHELLQLESVTKPKEKMMRKLFISLTLLLGACTAGDNISKLNAGMSKAQVVSIMGQPDGATSQGNQEGLIYANRMMNGLGSAWDRADYAVVLTDGKVTSYGPTNVRAGSSNVHSLFIFK